MAKRKLHGGRRALRWARNILFGVIGLLGVVLLTAYLVFQTGWGREVLRSQIETRMSDTFVGGAKIGRVTGNPLTELVLHDVVINGPDKSKAISVKTLTVKLPLMPLISHQLRVDKVIADELEIFIKKDASGQLNLANLMKPDDSQSTWSVKLPNLEVHKGHVNLALGAEPIDLDNIELYVDAALPFAGPIDAAVSLSADWRQKKAPIDVATSIHIDDEVMAVQTLVAQVSDIDIHVTNARMPKGMFSKPFAGVVSVYAPAATVHALVPQVTLPGDLGLTVVARPDGRLTHALADGFLGEGRFQVMADADIQAKLARGVVSAESLDLDAITGGRLDGHGGAVAAFDIDGNDVAELPTARAMVTAWGQAGKAPPTHAVIAFESKGERLHAAVGAASATGLHASFDASVHKKGNALTLEHGTLIASTADAKRATQGLAPLRGALSANLTAEGPLTPTLDLAVAGHANGRRLRFNDISAAAFQFRIDATHIPSKPVGSARLEVSDLRRADMELGGLTLAAGNRPDGKVQVSLRSKPKQAPWLVDLDALVTTGETIVVDLQRHKVRAAGGSVWQGATGQLTIGPKQIELRDFSSKTSGGSIAAAATFVRAGRHAGDLTAKLDATLEMKNLEKAYRGHADAHVDVARTAGRFAGSITAKATGVALDPKSPILLDADAKIVAQAGQLLANIDVASSKAGGAKIALDIGAPKDITNAKAWSKLDRSALHTAKLELDKINLEEIAKAFGLEPMKGTVDGSLQLEAATAGGTIKVRGVELRQTKDLGKIQADVKLEQLALDELKATVSAKLDPLPAAVAAKDVTQDGAARLYADAQFKTPDRLFDVTAWKRLGANAFRGASLRAERLAFQPGTLERLGIVSDLRGELAIGAEVDAGMKAARFSVNLHGLRGGMFAKPIAATVSGVLDDKSSRVIASVHAQNITLMRVSASVPLTLDEMRANPQAARTAPLTGTATIEHVPAVTLLGVLGTSQISSGMLDGTVKLGGTVAKPTVDAKLVARDVSVPPESTKQTQSIKILTIAAKWDGERGKVAIDGDQTGGGMLRLRGEGSPADLSKVSASIEAHRLDLAPLVAFMPGPAGGLGGRMDAKFAMTGADPRTTDLSGSLHITNGRIPIAPAVGTLFKGDVKVDIRNHALDVALTGKLGRGDLKLQAHAPLEGATPKNGTLTLSIHKVQLIGTTEPILTGVITANVARVDEVWQADVRINKMTVKVPPEKGTKLSPVGAPNDLVYGGEKIHHGVKKGKDAPHGFTKEDGSGTADLTTPGDLKTPSQVAGPVAKRRAPGDPVAVMKVTIRNVFVEAKEVRGLLGGNLRIAIADNQEVGITGFVSLTRGVLDLFSRHYQVDKANLQFDGSPDPVLDVRITHDFPEVTTITEVGGRMSKPKLALSSQPAQYTQAELLGFLLGGEPGGDPENAPSTSERVAGAGASFVSNKVGGYVKKALPVDIDVLRYEAASSTSSAAVTVGTWLTDTLFLAYRQHLEARPDENAGEGEVEYWIRRRLVLEAVVGDRGVNGLDLLWRRRW
jgi:translocation and assembly module TamB